MDYLKRSKIESEADFTAFIYNTHKNAVYHGNTHAIGDWRYDVHHSLLSDKPTKLLRNEILNWFGGKEKFIALHKRPADIKKTIFCDV